MKIYSHLGMDGDLGLSAFFLNQRESIEFAFVNRLPLNADGVGVDIAGGMFDHHYRPEHRCSANMVAEVIWEEELPEKVQELLGYVNRVDLKGKDEPTSLLSILKCVNRYGLNHHESYQWVSEAFEAFLKTPEKLLSPTKKEKKVLQVPLRKTESQQVKRAISLALDGRAQKFSVFQCFFKISRLRGIKEAKTWIMQGIHSKEEEQANFRGAQKDLQDGVGKTYIVKALGKNLKILAVETENPELHKAARALQYAAVIQRFSKTAQVFINSRMGLKMKFIAPVVRAWELTQRGIQTSPEKLTGMGTLPQVPQWHVMENCMLNGSLKHSIPKARQTKLSLEMLTEAVIIALQSRIRLDLRFRNCPLCEGRLYPGTIICLRCNSEYWRLAKLIWQKGSFLNFNDWLRKKAEDLLSKIEVEPLKTLATKKKIALHKIREKAYETIPKWRLRALQKFREGRLL